MGRNQQKGMTLPRTTRYYISEWEHIQMSRNRWQNVLDRLLLAAWFAIIATLISLILNLAWLRYTAWLTVSVIVLYILVNFIRFKLHQMIGSSKPPAPDWQPTTEYQRRLENARRQVQSFDHTRNFD